MVFRFLLLYFFYNLHILLDHFFYKSKSRENLLNYNCQLKESSRERFNVGRTFKFSFFINELELQTLQSVNILSFSIIMKKYIIDTNFVRILRREHDDTNEEQEIYIYLYLIELI